MKQSAATEASDVFSLGVVFLEMMTLKHMGSDGHPKQLLGQIGAVVPNLKWMKPLLKRMVDWDPTKRPSSARVAEVLEKMRHQEHVLAATTTTTVAEWTVDRS
eukprot:GABV01015192.1.p2 GENE.GABV01015192.1~~GABV01015192.1.p2  ORF type:complete len:103 (+),score=32.42 GABV01015192.1:75-383(+)